MYVNSCRRRFYPGAFLRLLVATVCLAATPPALSAQTAETAPATTAPAGSTDAPGTLRIPTKEERAERLMTYLQEEYEKILKMRKGPVSRSLALICLARLPRPAATEVLVTWMSDKQADPLVRLVAWQAVVARMEYLTPQQFERWLSASYELHDAGVIRGQLRRPLLQMMELTGPTPANRRLFMQVFEQTNSMWNSEDGPIVVQLGSTLKQWRDAQTVELLLPKILDLHDSQRAERVLNMAGLSVPSPGELHKLGTRGLRQGKHAAFVALFAKERKNWPGQLPPKDSEPWRKIEAQYIPATDWKTPVDSSDPAWRRDLELGAPAVQSLDLVFIVDATGSMDKPLGWLRRDLKEMMRALAVISPEPRIGLTFYKDKTDEFLVQSTPLTNKWDVLVEAVKKVTPQGGGDVPEAVLEGLEDAARKHEWRRGAHTKLYTVLIGDAPPHAQTQIACESLVARMAKANVKLYTVNTRSGYTTKPADPGTPDKKTPAPATAEKTADEWAAETKEAFTRLAKAGGGQYFELSFGAEGGAAVLTALMIDAINPQFGDRVEPFTKILLHSIREPVPEVQQEIEPFTPRAPGKPWVPPDRQQPVPKR